MMISNLKKYFIYNKYYGLKEVLKDFLDLFFYVLLRPWAWWGAWQWKQYRRKGKIKKILIIFWGAIGDVITSSAAIGAVRHAYPEAEITFLGPASIFQVFPGDRTISHFIDYDRTRKYRFREFIRNLRQIRYDLTMNLKWSSDRAALMTLLSRARFKLGSGPRHWQFLYNLKARPAYTITHQVERFIHIIEVLGIKGKTSRPVIIISAESKKAIDSFWRKKKLSKERVILVHPGAKEANKRWDIGYFSRLIQLIRRSFPYKVLIAWGPGEYALASYLKKHNRVPEVLIGPETKNINQLAALIRRCDLFIGNCSAPMNVAVAVDTPSVVIMGSQNPVVWSPYGPEHEFVLPSYRCRECRSPCSLDHKCQKSIRVEDVFLAVQKKLQDL